MLIEDLIAEAGRLFGTSVGELRSPSRHQPIVRARFALCAALRERGASYSQIGRWLGGRDHTTIMHAVERAAYIAEREPPYAAAIEYLADYEYEKEACNV